MDALHRISEVTSLDFFGIDFCVLPDDRLLVFEANAAMRHNFDHVAAFPYTKPHLDRISTAFTNMVLRRIAAHGERVSQG